MKRRYTGPDAETRATIYHRDGGRCVVCGGGVDLQAHHRRPRAAGGTLRPETNLPGNLILVCEPCHADIESRRELARARGYLVPQHGDPTAVPILRHGAWWLLHDDGTAEHLPEGRCAEPGCEREAVLSVAGWPQCEGHIHAGAS